MSGKLESLTCSQNIAAKQLAKAWQDDQRLAERKLREVEQLTQSTIDALQSTIDALQSKIGRRIELSVRNERQQRLAAENKLKLHISHAKEGVELRMVMHNCTARQFETSPTIAFMPTSLSMNRPI